MQQYISNNINLSSMPELIQTKQEADTISLPSQSQCLLKNSDFTHSAEQISKSTTMEEEEEEEEEYEEYQKHSHDEDYTENSYNYPNYSDDSAQEEKQLMLLQSYHNQETFQFSSDENGGNTQYKFTTIPRNLQQKFEQQLYGDLIFESDYSSQGEKSLNSFCNWKVLHQGAKFQNYVTLHSHDLATGCENFIAAIQVCLQYQTQEFNTIAALLTEFSRIYNFIKGGYGKMAQYIEIFSKHDALKRRQMIFQRKSDEFLSSLPQDTLFFAVKVSPNFQSLQSETQSLCFSNAFLQLVNINPDQFITVSLKGKTPEFFGWQARVMFLRHKLFAYLRKPITQPQEHIDILTRDGMRVPAQTYRERYTFDIDKEVPELELGQLTEFMVVYYFLIDSTAKNQIQFMRDNHKMDGFDSMEQSDFNYYSLETQAFLDMYYSHYPPSQKQQQKRLRNQTAN